MHKTKYHTCIDVHIFVYICTCMHAVYKSMHRVKSQAASHLVYAIGIMFVVPIVLMHFVPMRVHKSCDTGYSYGSMPSKVAILRNHTP